MLASMPATFVTLILQLSTAFRHRKTWDLNYKHDFQLFMDIADKLYVSKRPWPLETVPR